MNIKIGILTFHRVYNYGAFLQAYALKTYLEGKGCSVVFIDYQSLAHTQSYNLINESLFKILGPRGKFSLLVKSLLKFPRQMKRYSKMNKLQKKYLGIKGMPKDRIDDIDTDGIGLIIYGSDQIWRKSEVNPDSGFDPIYWGEGFEDIRKITYAASMGIVDLSEKDKNFIDGHLKLFSRISCREENLVAILSQITERKIHHVLDPVFLLTKNDWELIINPKRSMNSGRKYVLVYNLTHSRDVNKLAERIAEIKGLEIIEMTGSVQPYTFDKNIKQTEDALDFLAYIHDAEFVVASSFHAIAFSIIFKVNFYAAGMGKNSERVRSLLEIAQLQDRLIDEMDFSEIKETDFTHTDLSHEIDSSKDYLNSSLESDAQ